MCGGKRAATRLRSRGCDTVGKLYATCAPSTAGEGSFFTPSTSFKGPSPGSPKLEEGERNQSRKPRGGRGGKQRLREWVGDQDLAERIPSLLSRPMSAFDKLQKRVVNVRKRRLGRGCDLTDSVRLFRAIRPVTP